jgi:hypothetical protein
LTISGFHFYPFFAVIHFSAEFAHPGVFRELCVLFLLDFFLWFLTFAQNANSETINKYVFLAARAYPFITF